MQWSPSPKNSLRFPGLPTPLCSMRIVTKSNGGPSLSWSVVVPAAEIRDHETGLVSGPFSWFQSRQLFLETHETEANSISYFQSLFFIFQAIETCK